MLKYLLINRIFTYFNYCQIIFSILADFGIDHLVMSLCRFVSWVVGKGCCMTNVLSWQNSVSLCPASFCTPKPNLMLFQVSLNFLLLHSDPYDEKDMFLVLVLCLVGLHRTNQLQLLRHQWLGQTWIPVMLNNFPWKWTETILSFLRLHPSTVCWSSTIDIWPLHKQLLYPLFLLIPNLKNHNDLSDRSTFFLPKWKSKTVQDMESMGHTLWG